MQQDESSSNRANPIDSTQETSLSECAKNENSKIINKELILTYNVANTYANSQEIDRNYTNERVMDDNSKINYSINENETQISIINNAQGNNTTNNKHLIDKSDSKRFDSYIDTNSSKNKSFVINTEIDPTCPLNYEEKKQIKKILTKLLNIKDSPIGTRAGITKEDVDFITSKVIPIFESEPSLLKIKAPLMIVGDLHAQFHDVIRIFESIGYPPKYDFVFLGDYVDRGMHSVETICLLFCYKILYPSKIFMLRGNHECSYINRLYGFFDECLMYYSIDYYKKINEAFKDLPIAAIIDDKIFCIHGGLSPDLKSLDDIKNISRPVEIPEEGLLCDLLWADPNPDIDGWSYSQRGSSYCFGADVVEEFLKKHDFDLVCRAHQAVMDGFEFPFPNNQCLVTIFSAPNYCYEYDNCGAVLQVDETLFCSFIVIDPKRWILDEQPLIERAGTPPHVF